MKTFAFEITVWPANHPSYYVAKLIDAETKELAEIKVRKMYEGRKIVVRCFAVVDHDDSDDPF